MKLGFSTNYQLKEYFRLLDIPLVGIFNRDELPSREKTNGCYLVNMEASNDENGDGQQGSHWVCFYCDDDNALYFDAFGVVPPLEVMYYLKDYPIINYNKKQIQPLESKNCGWFCMVWCWFIHNSKYKLIGMKQFNKLFKLNGIAYNDKVLRRLIKYLLG